MTGGQLWIYSSLGGDYKVGNVHIEAFLYGLYYITTPYLLYYLLHIKEIYGQNHVNQDI